MDKFNWTKEYSVNVEMIDEQHRQFLNIVNKIGDFINNKETQKEVLFDIVNQLGNYALYHLGTEEEIFAKYNYPDASPHIEAHNQFRKMAEDYINKIRNENQDILEIEKLSEEVAEYTGNWLLNHILVVDKKYSAFFNEHGVK